MSEEIIFSKDGAQYINGLIAQAIENGSRTVTVKGNHLISEAIRIPSDFTLVLDSCYLKLADGCYSNIFVNEHHDTPLGKTTAGTDRNINIIGQGNAILDGGNYNGLSEKTQLKNGLPAIWKNNLILFTNVDGFRISGISCYNQRWWALNFVYCSNGYLGNIDFCANDTAIDPDGNIYHGLKRNAYRDILVKNADGIDLRQGCHDIVIENITGFTEDDSVALTGLDWCLEQTFAVEGLSSDICNIEIKNIKTAAHCTNVRLLNQSGIKLHDILIDGVYDVGLDSPHMEEGLYAVRVGDTDLYGTRHSTKEETYNITIKNIYGAGLYTISLAGNMEEPILENINASGKTELILDERKR